MIGHATGVFDRHLSVAEHETVPVLFEGGPESLTSAEAELLLRLNDDRPGFCERRHRSVRFAQYCGVVNLGNRALEVVPKVSTHVGQIEGRRILLRLLRASGVADTTFPLSARQHLERLALLDIFITLFLDSVRTVVRGGLLRQYIEREHDLPLVRGRIVFSRQFSVNFNRPDIVASRFDDHTPDNRWNRAVKAALRVVRLWIASGDLYRRWVELVVAFEDVTDVHLTAADVDRFVFDRQANRYRPTIQWTRLILSLLSPSLRAGETTAPAFLFDMNVLFEKAVARTLRRRLGRTHPHLQVRDQVLGRHLSELDGARRRRVYGLKPDILVTHGSTIVLIADTKWKRPQMMRSGHVKPSRADMYQMMAYAAAFQANHLVLLYPAGSPAAYTPATSFLLPRTFAGRPIVHVARVDVSSDELRVIEDGGHPLLQPLREMPTA